MINDRVTVLDINSSCVTIVSGERGVNNSLMIHNYLEVQYVGFDEEGFLPPTEDALDIKQALYKAIDTILRNSNVTLDEIYVGVPGNFLKIKTKRHVYTFNKNKIITNADVEKFKETGYSDIQINGYQQIMANVIDYTFADGRVIDNPVGLKSVNLNGIISYSLCKSSFKQEIDRILLQKYNFKKINYLSSPVCQSRFLFDKDVRDNYAVLLDVGSFDTTLSVCYKNGLVFQKTFEKGGANVTENIMMIMDMPKDYECFELAEILKKKANLGLNSNRCYVASTSQKEVKYQYGQINNLIKGVLIEIAGEVSACLELCKWLPPNARIGLTGSGVATIRGAGECLRDLLDRGVDVVYSDVPLFKKPKYSASLSLMAYAVLIRE